MAQAGVLPLLQGAGAWSFPLAKGHGKQGYPNPGAVGDALGRHGLASAEVDERAHKDVGKAVFLLVFMDFRAALL
jgi:hypothetical protein